VVVAAAAAVVVVVVVAVISMFLVFYPFIFEKDSVFYNMDPFPSTGEMVGRHLLSWVQLGIYPTN
jgi:hypothetical protein